MNLDFSDDQKFLKEEARKFLSKEDALKIARESAESDVKNNLELWNKIIDLGWHSVRIPEKYGGLGLSNLELCVIAEELGRSLAPTPFSSSVYLFTELIIDYGSEEQKEEILPKLIAGDIIGTVAFAEDITKISKDNIQTKFDNGVLNGKKIAVSDGTVATHALVLASSNNQPIIVLVDLKTTGVEKSIEPIIDETRDYCNLELKGCEASVIGEEGNGYHIHEAVLDKAAVYFAFEQIGGAQASLDMAVNYAKERFAFGRAIGSFQAIKHKLADMYVALTLAQSNAYYAAYALSSNTSDLSLAAATARVSSTKAYELCSKENIQTHGGNGFTWEYDCHLFYKRSRLLSLNIGSQKTWKEKLVSSLEKSN